MAIGSNLVLEERNRLEPALVAQALDKADAQARSIEITIEVEDVRLDCGSIR